METDRPDSETRLGFSFRRLALAVFVLLASRGAIEVVSDGNRLAGVVVVVLVSVVGGWLLLRYEASSHGE